MTPLHMMIHCNFDPKANVPTKYYISIVELFAKKGANLYLKVSNGNNLLHIAIIR